MENSQKYTPDPPTHSDEKKMKFIYEAIEKGFTVKKTYGDNSYEFVLPLNKKIVNNKLNKNLREDIRTRRSVSTPITKQEIIQKVFVPREINDDTL